MSGTLLVADEHCASEAEATLWRWIERADAAVNRFLPDSEISRLNRDGELHDVSDDFFRFLDAARYAYEITDGLCDPAVAGALAAWGYAMDFDDIPHDVVVQPSPRTHGIGSWEITPSERYISSCCPLDFGASAKALVVDLVVADIASFSDVLVEIGGDVGASTSLGGGEWTVGVAPDGPVADAPQISIRSGGVATSTTTYRTWSTDRGRAHHIIDPRTGAPAESTWRAASIAAETCVDANAYATATFLWNDEAPWHIAQSGWAGRLVDRNGEILTVGSWPREDE
jgi:thiamine biosynthesis lipoprotein